MSKFVVKIMIRKKGEKRGRIIAPSFMYGILGMIGIVSAGVYQKSYITPYT